MLLRDDATWLPANVRWPTVRKVYRDWISSHVAEWVKVSTEFSEKSVIDSEDGSCVLCVCFKRSVWFWCLIFFPMNITILKLVASPKIWRCNIPFYFKTSQNWRNSQAVEKQTGRIQKCSEKDFFNLICILMNILVGVSTYVLALDSYICRNQKPENLTSPMAGFRFEAEIPMEGKRPHLSGLPPQCC